MSIENQRQLQNTRIKLAELEQLYVETCNRATDNEHVRKLTLRSLKKRNVNRASSLWFLVIWKKVSNNKVRLCLCANAKILNVPARPSTA